MWHQIRREKNEPGENKRHPFKLKGRCNIDCFKTESVKNVIFTLSVLIRLNNKI